MHFRWHRAVNRRIVPFLFCLPFANRASDSGDLYIDFDWNQLIFPATYLVCQVDALFIFFPSRARICIAYHISHIMPCFASCCLRIAPWLIVGPLLVFLFWIEPGDEYVIEEPVEYAYEDQAFVNSENFVGKMTIPSISLLSLLDSCLLYWYAILPTTCFIMPPRLPCQASNPPFLANRCLAMLPLCSAPLIALLVAGEVEVCSMLEHGYVGISQYPLF